jgi:phosphohistidine phosphatase
MKLYLVQHGEAVPDEADPARPLTSKGRLDVLKVASVIKTAGILSVPIRHSGKTRAKQTAEIIASAIGSETLMVAGKNLNPNDDIRPASQDISAMSEDLMIVGHLPFLGKLASFLLTGSENAGLVAFRMGGAVCLVRDEKKWQIAWAIVPELIQY